MIMINSNNWEITDINAIRECCRKPMNLKKILDERALISNLLHIPFLIIGTIKRLLVII